MSKESARRASRKYKQNHKAQAYLAEKKWREKNPDRWRLLRRRHILKKRYGLTFESLGELRLSQKNSELLTLQSSKKRSILDQLELAAICIQRYYCGLAPEYKNGRLMITLKAVIDDSGDESTFVLGGFIAPIIVWDKFSSDWVNVCKEPPVIGYYRTNDAIGLKRCFSNFDRDVRNQKIAKLASVIPTENCYGIAAYLSKSDLKIIKEFYSFNSLFPSNDPYFICAALVVAWVCFQCVFLFPGIGKRANPIDFIFDEQGKVGRRFRIIFDDYIKSQLPDLPRLGKCDHWDDKQFPPLQAADMYASWIRRGASSRIQMWNAADIYLSNIKSRTLEIDRKFLNQFIARLKKRR